VIAGNVYDFPLLNRTEKPQKLWEIYGKEHQNPTKTNKPAVPSKPIPKRTSPPKQGKTKKRKKTAPLKQTLVVHVGIIAADAGIVATAISSQYVQPLAEGFQAGRGTFLSLLHYVTEESRSKSCLSYYYVCLVETFDLFKRLVTDMERVHVDSLRHYDEINDSDIAKEAVLRELQSLEVYETKRDELGSILSFAKYKLKAASVDDKHLFLDWHCSIRTWCKGPQQRGYQEFRN
jgi:hypothetical protein